MVIWHYRMFYDFGIKNTILKFTYKTKLGDVACILEDSTMNKIISTNFISNLKYRMKFHGDM